MIPQTSHLNDNVHASETLAFTVTQHGIHANLPVFELGPEFLVAYIFCWSPDWHPLRLILHRPGVRSAGNVYHCLRSMSGSLESSLYNKALQALESLLQRNKPVEYQWKNVLICACSTYRLSDLYSEQKLSIYHTNDHHRILHRLNHCISAPFHVNPSVLHQIGIRNNWRLERVSTIGPRVGPNTPIVIVYFCLNSDLRHRDWLFIVLGQCRKGHSKNRAAKHYAFARWADNYNPPHQPPEHLSTPGKRPMHSSGNMYYPVWRLLWASTAII